MRSKLTRVGERNFNKGGLVMEIIKYRGATDLDVIFSDGTIVKHKTYDKFKKGQITNPKKPFRHYNSENRLKKYRAKITGQITTSSCGQKMIIIAVNNAKDITVKFEDGIIVEHCTYGNFKKGKIKNPNDNYWTSMSKQDTSERLGEKRYSRSTKELATVIEYTNSRDVVIEFENGKRKKVRYQQFKNGRFSSFSGIKGVQIFKNQSRIGEVSYSSKGQKMTLIAYRNANDIDVKFEDGTIVNHTQYQHFKSGYVKNPTYKMEV